MPVMFWIAWFGLRLVALTVLAALTAMTYDALQDRPTKRYSFAYAASLGGAPLTRERTHPTTRAHLHLWKCAFHFGAGAARPHRRVHRLSDSGHAIASRAPLHRRRAGHYAWLEQREQFYQIRDGHAA